MDESGNLTAGPPAAPKNRYQAEKESDSLIKSGLKLNHLRLISALADHGQVSAAAEALTISQPAASRMLHEIESILKAPLCDRVAKGMVMTRFGDAMARRARAILLEIREADREITELKTGYGGSVNIGSVTAPAISLAVPAINRVRALYPSIQINIQQDTSNSLARDLISARYDFIMGRMPDDMSPRQFDARPLGLEKACIVARAGHPVLRKRPVSLAELSEFEWVFQPPGSLLRRTLEVMFIERGLPLPSNVVSTPSVTLTMALIAETDAIAPIAEDVARFIAASGNRMGQIAIVETDFHINLKPYSLITARGRALPPSAKLLHDVILDECERIRLDDGGET
ncbi:LysR substrate-binding domain-containing protein [Rhizobium sp. FKL33]|uniref:LysR substrate-binding domain-containing protein n=1 Tax=Rhizobium sp. FKL33 TaxID=2562307 RepID=UPI0010BF6731|nr:LysR substrate-binding domain-containing protein [Rhizobium sp. FKL33]